MQTVAAVRRLFFFVFESLAIAAFIAMLASSLLQVFCRYVLNNPLMWTEELARLMCVLTTYFGSVVVLLAREHIRVEMIDTLVGPRANAALTFLVDLLIAWFLVAVAYGCWLMTQATWTTFTATMPWFRMAYIYIAVGVALVTMTVIVVMDIYVRVLLLAGFGPKDGGGSGGPRGRDEAESEAADPVGHTHPKHLGEAQA